MLIPVLRRESEVPLHMALHQLPNSNCGNLWSAVVSAATVGEAILEPTRSADVPGNDSTQGRFPCCHGVLVVSFLETLIRPPRRDTPGLYGSNVTVVSMILFRWETVRYRECHAS